MTPMPTVAPAILFSSSLSFATAHGVGAEWPQWRGPTRDGVWHAAQVRAKIARMRLSLLPSLVVMGTTYHASGKA